MDQRPVEKVRSANQARQGSTGNHLRYILGIGTVLAAIGLFAIYASSTWLGLF